MIDKLVKFGIVSVVLDVQGFVFFLQTLQNIQFALFGGLLCNSVTMVIHFLGEHYYCELSEDL